MMDGTSFAYENLSFLLSPFPCGEVLVSLLCLPHRGMHVESILVVKQKIGIRQMLKYLLIKDKFKTFIKR